MMRFLISATGAALLLVLAAAAGAQDTTPDLDQAIRTDFEQAEANLAAAEAEKDEEKREPHLAKFRQALDRIIAKYTMASPALREGLFELGRSNLLAGRPAAAVDDLRRHVEVLPDSPRHAEAVLLLGDAYMGTSDFGRARALYEDFIAKGPPAEKLAPSHYGRAMALWMSADLEGSARAFREILDRFPSDPIATDASFQLLRVLTAADRIDEARAQADQILAKYPEAPEIQDIRGRLDLIGAPAPEIAGEAVWSDGARRTLGSLKGRPVLLIFFADQYASCRSELRRLATLAESRSAAVTFVGLTTYYRKKSTAPEEERRIVTEALRADGVTFPVGFAPDHETLRAWRVRGVPEVVVIDAEGRVRHIKVGSARNQGIDDTILVRWLDRLASR